ncbi:MAG: ribonuclease HII [Longimicrobiales bacterium]
MSERDRLRKRRNARRRELRRLKKLLELERSLWARGTQRIAGIDEAGRGPLAGPVVAAAVVFTPDCAGVARVDDSKRLAPPVREELATEICQRALCWAVGAASAREIDRINILRASHLAMRRAIQRLRLPPQHLIVDGLRVPELGEAQTPVVDGDALVHCVACASIVAKVTRDRLMTRLAARYPGYGWESNAGYATADHREALLRLGPTPHHRLSFSSLQFGLGLDDVGPLPEGMLISYVIDDAVPRLMPSSPEVVDAPPPKE